MFSTFRTPLITFVFALAGASLAWSWFSMGWVVPTAIVIALWALVLGVQAWEVSRIRRNPVGALRILEWRALGVGLVSASLGAMAIIVTVWFSLSEAQKKALGVANVEVITSVGAAITAFVAAIAVTAEALDKNVGDFVMTQFRKNLTTENEAGKLQLTGDVDTLKRARAALYSTKDFGWTDWSRENRKKRVDAIAACLP